MGKLWYLIKHSYSIIMIAVGSLLVFPMISAYADDYTAWPGEFMRMGAGARALGMGNAYTAVEGDIYSAYYNPAGLSHMEGRSMAFSYRYLTMDRMFRHFVFGSRIGPDADFAFSWLNAGTEDIEGRDLNGNPTGSIQDTRNSFAITFARQVNPWLSIGMNAKMTLWKLADEDARAFGIDLGILATPIRNLSLGVNIRDINSRFTWKSDRWQARVGGADGQTIEKEDKFPLYVTAGAAYRMLQEKLLFSVSIEHLEDNPLAANFGAQYACNDLFTLRTGYYHYTADDELETGSITAGFSVALTRSTCLDYAYATDGVESDGIHSVSLVLEYGE